MFVPAVKKAGTGTGTTILDTCRFGPLDDRRRQVTIQKLAQGLLLPLLLLQL